MRGVLKLITMLMVVSCVGCASIINQGKKEIKVASSPPDAKVTAYDADGDIVQSAQTPAVLKLKRGAGYFKGAKYKLLVEKAGYKTTEVPLKSDITGWYWGNFGFGGLIGFLAVDPATGAMWTLSPSDVNVQLQGGQTTWNAEDGLMIVLKEQLSDEQQRRLVPLRGGGAGL
jgi:hypothetical protein